MSHERRGRLWGRNNWLSFQQSFEFNFSSYFLQFGIFLILILSISSPTSAQSGFFRSFFGVPDHCSNNGFVSSCTFLVRCLYEGGTPENSCGGGFLYTCCIKPIATVRSDVSNDIGSFNFFRGSSKKNTGFSQNVRTLGRAPPPSHFPDTPWLAKYLPDTRSEANQNFQRANLFESGVGERESSYQEIDDVRYYNEPECGIQHNKGFSKRIIGGDEAKFAELPWQAHIRISGYQCGGVLVNRYFVATAAHCVHKARLDQITIHLGEYDTKDTGDYYEPYPKESFSVIEKKTHPRFKYMLTQPDRFDVAVLRLSHPAYYRQNIVPICLPSPNDDFEDMLGIVAGWGKTDTSFGKTGTNILRKVIVPVINNKECLRWHHLKNIDVKLHYEMFCAGHSEGTMDACLGDSGGPLVIYHRGRWRLAGITSAGFGCAVDHQPGIYHKVSVTAGWIAANVRP